MKKICMISYSYYSHDARVMREAEALAQQGMMVDCFCLKEKGHARSQVVNGVNVYHLPLYKYRGSSTIRYMLAYILFFVLAFFVVSKFYFIRRYDVIQFHTLPDFIIFVGIIPHICGAKLLLDMHEIMPEFYMSKFGVGMSHPFIKLLKWLEKISIRFADAVITVNDPIKRLLLQRCKPKSDITVVMNCADERVFRTDYHERSVASNNFTIMYHGTLTALYGLETAIRAVAKLRDKVPNLRCRIFGHTIEAGDLKELADRLRVSDIVNFMGRVPNEEIPKYIEQANVGVLPTVRDIFTDLSFSNKLAEYVYMKMPVVATRLNSTLEYFPEDAISYFESGDADALAWKILELYQNPKKCLSQAQKAFQHYQKIRWLVMKKRYLALIDSLIGGLPNGSGHIKIKLNGDRK